MIRWTPDAIRFLRDASEYGTYYRQLAELIAPKIQTGGHVCDAGCGLGYLALELAGRAAWVTAADANRDALHVLKENAQKRHVDNLSICCGDIEHLVPDAPYDAMVFCFFGSIGEVLRIARAQCRGEVVMIARNYARHRFSAGTHPIAYGGYREACDVLEQLGVPFEREEHVLDFSQPFADLKDARRFFGLYSRDESGAITDDYLRNRLMPVDNGAFKYLLSHKRAVGMVHFRTRDIVQNERTEK